MTARLSLGGARVGIVLGSGAAAFVSRIERPRRTPFRAIPGVPAASVVGHSGELVTGRVAGVPVAVLAGRVHFYEGHPMSRVVAAVRALARGGIRAMILTNAAGGIRRSLSPGDLMLVSDHINAFGTNPLIGQNDDRVGPRFPDMSIAYDPAFRTIARKAARRLRNPLSEGVYVGLHGPSFETPAEIRMWRKLGADAVGMSTVPEVIALRHAGVRVLAVSTITNMAAGVLPKPLDHEEVLETGARVAERLGKLIEAIVPAIDAAVRE